MEKQKQLPKSRWLFLSLLSLLLTLGGSTSAWAENAYTTGFESTDGWATISAMGGEGSKWSSQGSYVSDYELSTTYKYQGSKGLYNAQTNSTAYFITPKLAAGTISFWAAGKKESGGNNNYVRVYKCTDNGDGTFTIDTENNLSTHSYYNYSGTDYLRCNKNSLTYTQYSFELDADSHLAFLVSRAGIDNFSASNGLASSTPVEGPKLAVKDGETPITSPYAFDFGQTKVGSTHTFTLSNTGAGNIEGLSVSETGSFGAELSANTTEGGDVTLTITMPATTSTSDITISSTTEGIDDFVINASATVAATFAIDATSYNFGMVAKNAVAEKTFNITNSGNKDLEVTFTNGTNFTVDKKNKKFITFSNNKKWDKVYLYAWKNSTENLTASWPGDEQTNKIGTNIYGEDIYLIEIPEGTENIIIDNNSDSQTQDLTMDYSKSGLYLGDAVAGKYAGVFYGAGDLLVPIGLTAPFTIQMNTATVGAKAAEDIALAYTASNGTSTNVNVSGYVIDDTKYYVDFNGNALPDGWKNSTNGGTAWTFADGVAYGQYASYKNAKMMSPLLTVAGGESLVFQTKGNTSYADMKVNVYQRDGSTLVKTVDFSTEARAAYTANQYTTVTLSGLDAGDYKLEFEAYNSYIDNINGFTVNPNDPQIAVSLFNGLEPAIPITSGTLKDFGWSKTDVIVLYNISNSGTGTLNISNIDVPAGFTAVTYGGAMSVAAGNTLTLTVTMTSGNVGPLSGTITLTTDGGNFEIPVKGFIYGDKNLVDFTDASQYTGWTTTGWTINEGVASVSSSNTMQTTKFSVAANEKLYVEAKSNGSYYNSASLSYSYSTDNGTNWTDGSAAIIPSTTSSSDYAVYTLSDIADAEAARTVLIRFTGANVAINRIYGFTAVATAVMETTAADIAFGTQTAESAEQTFTISNTGTADLTGLSVTLAKTDEDAQYAVRMEKGGETFAGTTLAPSEVVTVYVKQLFDINKLGSKSDVLTIAATEQTPVAINLTGTTKDPLALDIDFSNAGVWPSEILEHGATWGVNYGYAYQSSTGTASALTLTPLTVASVDDKLNFNVAYYSSYNSSARDLSVSYTTDGGLSWKDYNWGTVEDPVTSLKSQIGSSLTSDPIVITGISAGTVVFKFNGKYIKLDNITGDMKKTTAPLMTLTTVSDGISGANLKADGVAVYTLANNGNADYVATVALDNVTADVTGEDVTYAANTLTIPAGKTATITVTMKFEAPYGVKTGSMDITSTSWVGDINKAYTATLVDPTNFVEDFSGNAKPAGWYSDGWTYTSGAASVVAGVEKPMITEKIGAVDGKNELKFNAWTTSDDPQTLKVYTSTDRKNWTQLGEDITLTKEEDALYSRTLTNGDQYIKFGGVIAKVDNITGVKKLDAPAHDLYEISTVMPNSGTPGASYTATVTGVSLRADENDIVAELWLQGATKPLAKLEHQEMLLNTNKTFELTGNLPAVEGAYKMWITVKRSDDAAYFNTETIDFTIAHTTSLHIDDFNVAASPVQADNNNKFVGTYNVTVQNTGSKTLAADEVSISLVNAEIGRTTAASSFVFVTPGAYTGDNAVIAIWNWSDEFDGEWVLPTDMGAGLFTAELKEGKQDFSVVRLKPSTDPGYDAENNGINWNNKWNESEVLTISEGKNVFAFDSWGGGKDNFSKAAYTLAAGETVLLPVYVTGTLTDGENGAFATKAEENIGHTQYGSGLTCTLNVTAAPVIVLDETVGTVASSGQNRKVTLQHKFNAGWNTICVPFAMTTENIEAAFGAEAKVYGFTGYNAGQLAFSKVTAMDANAPYIVYTPSAINSDINLAGMTVNDAAAGSVVWDVVTFQGTYLPMAAGTMTGNYGVTSAGKIAKAGTGASMKGFRAYFTGIPDGATAHIAIYDDATGITTILDEKELNYDGKIYNLNGQRVENAHKGIFIVNGKKVVVK